MIVSRHYIHAGYSCVKLSRLLVVLKVRTGEGDRRGRLVRRAFASSWPLIADERVEEHIFLIIGPLDTNDYARSGKNALAILGDAILIELPRHHKDRKSTRLNSSH